MLLVFCLFFCIGFIFFVIILVFFSRGIRVLGLYVIFLFVGGVNLFFALCLKSLRLGFYLKRIYFELVRVFVTGDAGFSLSLSKIW